MLPEFDSGNIFVMYLLVDFNGNGFKFILYENIF